MSQISSHNSSIRYLSPRNSRCKCTSCMISYSCSRSRCTCIDTHMDRYRKQRLQNRRRQRSRWQEWCQQWYQGRVQWLIFPLMLGRVFLHSARPTTQYSLPPLQPHNSIHTVEYTHYIRQLSRLAYNPTCRSPSPTSLSYLALQDVRYQNCARFGLARAKPWDKVHQ